MKERLYAGEVNYKIEDALGILYDIRSKTGDLIDVLNKAKQTWNSYPGDLTFNLDSIYRQLHREFNECEKKIK